MIDTLLGLTIRHAPAYAVLRIAQAAARWKLKTR